VVLHRVAAALPQRPRAVLDVAVASHLMREAANMTTNEFWRRQEFSYLITYSFNRGHKLAALRDAAKALFQQTRKELLTTVSVQLPALREQLHLLKHTYHLDSLTLTQGHDAFHITASPVARIEKDTVVAQKLASILQTQVVNRIHWMCGPIYRDAVAFYDEEHRLVNVLNICFSCDRMVTAGGVEIAADTDTYQALSRYLVQLWHLIVAEER
jgi:hypothetical protein